jgi:hypothetical protein
VGRLDRSNGLGRLSLQITKLLVDNFEDDIGGDGIDEDEDDEDYEDEEDDYYEGEENYLGVDDNEG